MAGLYLHIPFCEHKCIYCDFYSIENLSPMSAFLNALEQEIGMYGQYGSGETFETIFFGGGTPSLLPPAQLGKILSRLSSVFAITPHTEITVETNPGTVDEQKLADYRALGVNRLSIGIQSFHEDDLRFLTRIHSAQQAKECVRNAHRVGFHNVSLDLIFALPQQTLERWQSNIYQALELEPTHISAYSLIVERGTPLARMVAAKQVSPLPEEYDVEMYEWTMDALASAGYEQYEVSNFAKPGFRSRHNSNYWNHTDYLGFGPSAHAFWSSRRWWNAASLSTYIEKIARGIPPIAGEECLSDMELFEEAVMLGLRSDGIDLHDLQERYGIDLLEDACLSIDCCINDGLAVVDRGKLRLTGRGYLVCDDICQRILVELDQRTETVEV